MNIVVVGCTSVGAGLAQLLSQRQHHVSVIDPQSANFDQLRDGFRGTLVRGEGFDRASLLKAGIEQADGLAAVTNNDEVNLVVARLARQFFEVPRVVARVYDQRKAPLYQLLGIQKITPISWGINRIAELLSYSQFHTLLTLGTGEVELVEVEASAGLEGRLVRDLSLPGEIHVVTISRGGRTLLPLPSTGLEQGDLLQLAVLNTAVPRLAELLGFS